MFLIYNDRSILGVSLKAGGKKTSEPQLNTYTNPVFNAFGEQRKHNLLMKQAYAQIYSKIPKMPPMNKFKKTERHNKF